MLAGKISALSKGARKPGAQSIPTTPIALLAGTNCFLILARYLTVQTEAFTTWAGSTKCRHARSADRITPIVNLGNRTSSIADFAVNPTQQVTKKKSDYSQDQRGDRSCGMDAEMAEWPYPYLSSMSKTLSQSDFGDAIRAPGAVASPIVQNHSRRRKRATAIKQNYKK